MSLWTSDHPLIQFAVAMFCVGDRPLLGSWEIGMADPKQRLWIGHPGDLCQHHWKSRKDLLRHRGRW